jgi:uncharacterized protein (UPF0216 family)
MTGELPYEKIVQEYLQGELRVVNTHIPGKQKSLSELLHEEFPHVVCNDGNTHLFKKKELNYLAGLLDSEEQEELKLPLFIEVVSGRGQLSVLCMSRSEEKVISGILGMMMEPRQNRIILHRPQLSVLRKHLKTTTQYLFAPAIV